MKNIRVLLIAVVILFITGSFLKPTAGSVKGSVNPADGAAQATLISATDTFKSLISNEGAFVITDVKPGSYTLEIQAKAPYKNVSRDNIFVTEGGTADIGEIKLSK